MTEKRLGKIQMCQFGYGGYQDSMLGIMFTLGGDGWGVGDFWGAWGHDIESTPNCKWTEQERLNQHGENALKISRLLKDAKVYHVQKLEGIPVEVEFDGNSLKSWRVLKEVL